MLSTLGYKFDLDELESWQVEAYSLIANTISELENKEMKSKRR
jgi:hypothetical protein